MANGNGTIPILGETTKPRVAVALPVALVRQADENATYEAEGTIMTPNGPIAIAGRKNLVDATELIEMFRRVVAEELDKRLGVRPKGQR